MPCQEWLGDPHIGQSPIFINAPSYVVHFVSASSSSTSNSSGDCVKILTVQILEQSNMSRHMIVLHA